MPKVFRTYTYMSDYVSDDSKDRGDMYDEKNRKFEDYFWTFAFKISGLEIILQLSVLIIIKIVYSRVLCFSYDVYNFLQAACRARSGLCTVYPVYYVYWPESHILCR